jgi:phosphonoacetaldehyde dehydrogenase
MTHLKKQKLDLWRKLIMKKNNSISNDKFDVLNPFNGDIVDSVLNMSRSQIHQILGKSLEFQCTLSAEERSEILLKTAEYLKKHTNRLAKLISLEAGLSLQDTVYEVGRVVNCARYSAKVCGLVEKDMTSEYVLDEVNSPELTVVSEPLDLVVGITPFNHPMNQVAHKIFPAIASGASIVIKPSEKTPLSALKLTEILVDCGLPINMVNVITGKNPLAILDDILSFQKLDMITFTGGLHAGLVIQQRMIDYKHGLKRYVPELGGCSSLIVCDDADLEVAVDLALKGCFKNSGQRCTAVRRVVVDNKIAEKFIDKLTSSVKDLNFGDPLNSDTDMGTVIDSNAANGIKTRIDSAIANGAKLLYGGTQEGALLSPTILDNVSLKMDLVSNETFGPVCPIIRANGFEEALSIAKNTNYRLACGIVTNDAAKALRASKELKVGQFNFNGPPGYRTEAAPFGGFGDSGNGEKEGIILAARGMRRIRTFYRH